MKCNGSFSASRSSLDHQDSVFRIAYDRVLLLLYGTHDILQLNITVGTEFLLQNLIIDLCITFKCIDHLSVFDLVLPLGGNLARHDTGRCFIGCRTFIIIVKQSADRSSPVIDQWLHTGSRCKVADSNIKDFCRIFSVINIIHTPEKRSIQHLFQSMTQFQFLLVIIDLMKQCLLVIIILITILIHLRIIFPVIFMHVLYIFLSGLQGKIYFFDAFFNFFCYFLQK